MLRTRTFKRSSNKTITIISNSSNLSYTITGNTVTFAGVFGTMGIAILGVRQEGYTTVTIDATYDITYGYNSLGMNYTIPPVDVDMSTNFDIYVGSPSGTVTLTFS